MYSSLPYRVEYSYGSQDCKKCSKSIKSGGLKIAIMMQVIILIHKTMKICFGRIKSATIFIFKLNHLFQSDEEDSLYPDWYHQKCFFQANLARTEAAFDGFAKLRYDDQIAIKVQLGKRLQCNF